MFLVSLEAAEVRGGGEDVRRTEWQSPTCSTLYVVKKTKKKRKKEKNYDWKQNNCGK